MPWKYNGQLVNTSKGFRKTDGYMTPKNWNAVWDDTEKKNQGLTWENESTPTQTDAEKLAGLRSLRNDKLHATDWRASTDLTMSDDWKTYRQSLRDLPASSNPKLDSEGYLDMTSVTWPTKPS